MGSQRLQDRLRGGQRNVVVMAAAELPEQRDAFQNFLLRFLAEPRQRSHPAGLAGRGQFFEGVHL